MENQVVNIQVNKGHEWIQFVISGGEHESNGDYTLTISPEALQPFIDSLQRFADDGLIHTEMYFDLPEGVIEEEKE